MDDFYLRFVSVDEKEMKEERSKNTREELKAMCSS